MFEMDILIFSGLWILGCFVNFLWEPGAKQACYVARAYLILTIILVTAAGLVNLAGIKSAHPLSALHVLLKYGGYLSSLSLGFLMMNILFKLWIKDSIAENGYLVTLVRTALWGASILTGIAFITETIWTVKNFGKMDHFFTISGYAVWFLYFITAAEFLGGLGILLNFRLKTGPLAACGLMLIMLGAVYTHLHNRDPFSDSYPAVSEFISLLLLLVMYYFEKQINRIQHDMQIYIV
jgi:DoxX-like protein